MKQSEYKSMEEFARCWIKQRDENIILMKKLKIAEIEIGKLLELNDTLQKTITRKDYLIERKYTEISAFELSERNKEITKRYRDKSINMNSNIRATKERIYKMNVNELIEEFGDVE